MFMFYTKFCNQWYFQEIHWHIELYQISDKDGIGKIQLCNVVYPIGVEGDRDITQYNVMYPILY